MQALRYASTFKTKHMKTHQQIAQKMLDCFEYQTREEKTCTKCNHKEEEKSWYAFKLDAIKEENDYYKILSNIIHSSNTGEDYIYNWIQYILEAIRECEDLENFDVSDFSVSLVSVYTHDLLEWLSSSIYNVDYLQSAVDEMGSSEGFQILAGAQFIAIDELTQKILNAVQNPNDALLNTKNHA